MLYLFYFSKKRIENLINLGHFNGQHVNACSNDSPPVIEINGQPGILTLVDGCIHSVTTFDMVDSYIQFVYTLRNPEKLKRMSQMTNLPS